MIKELVEQIKRYGMFNASEHFLALVKAVANCKQYLDKESIYICPDREEPYKFSELMRELGFDRAEQSRILACYDKYFSDNEIISLFTGFSKSQLYELLLVPSTILERDISSGRISPSMTIKSLRKYANAHKRKGAKDSLIFEGQEIDESGIEEVFSPRNYYDFSYFESKSKQQLLNIVWQLQKAIHRKE